MSLCRYLAWWAVGLSRIVVGVLWVHKWWQEWRTAIVDCRYLLSYSMKQSPSWEANRFLSSHFYGNRKFITTVTSACNLSVYWARSIQSMPPYLSSSRPTLILSSHLRLAILRSFSLRFPDQNTVYTSPIFHTCSMPHQFLFFSIWSPEKYCVRSTNH